MQNWKNGIQDRRRVAEWFIVFISSLQACHHARKIEIIVGDYGNAMSCPDIIAVHMPDCHINCPSQWSQGQLSHEWLASKVILQRINNALTSHQWNHKCFWIMFHCVKNSL
jgi:hypothetical protein